MGEERGARADAASVWDKDMEALMRLGDKVKVLVGDSHD